MTEKQKPTPLNVRVLDDVIIPDMKSAIALYEGILNMMSVMEGCESLKSRVIWIRNSMSELVEDVKRTAGL